MSKTAYDKSHLLNQWFSVKNRESLLSKCSALLCRDAVGRIMFLSAPRLVIDDNTKEKVIVAHSGNSLRKLCPVSIPVETLHKTVVGFMPENVHSAMATLIVAASKVHKGRVPTFKRGTTYIAAISTVLPLEFQIDVDEDEPHNKIYRKLADCHPYYADWIDTTDKLCQRYNGESLHHKKIGMKLPAKGREHLCSSVLVSPTSLNQNSLLWKELGADLKRLRAKCNSKCREDSERPTQQPTTFSETPAMRIVSKYGDEKPITFSPLSKAKHSPIKSLSKEAATEHVAAFTAKAPAKPLLSPTSQEMPPLELSVLVDEATPAVPSPSFSEMPPLALSELDEPTPTVPWLTTTAAAGLFANEDTVTHQVERGRAEKRPAIAPSGTGSKKPKLDESLKGKIHRVLAECRTLNIQNPSKILVSISCGYQNPASSRIHKAFKSIVDDNLAQNISGKRIALTKLGIETAPEVSVPETNAEVHRQFKQMANKLMKNGLTQKLDLVWSKLADGKIHSEEALACAAGYTNINSAGIRAIFKTMKELEIVHERRDKALQFNDIVFPFGRPSTTMHTTI